MESRRVVAFHAPGPHTHAYEHESKRDSANSQDAGSWQLVRDQVIELAERQRKRGSKWLFRSLAPHLSVGEFAIELKVQQPGQVKALGRVA